MPVFYWNKMWCRKGG